MEVMYSDKEKRNKAALRSRSKENTMEKHQSRQEKTLVSRGKPLASRFTRESKA